MKKFLLSSIVFLCSVIGSMFLVFSRADGYIDAFYIRFTTEKQSSLILGTSRAAQGLQPMVLNKILSRANMFNYSFTVAHSPYGPTYLSSIKRKLRVNSKDGIFIVTIDPWSISSICQNPDDSTQFRELKLCLAQTTMVNTKPNIQYLLFSFDEHYRNLLFKNNTNMFLHNDGWLEVNVSMDSLGVQKRLEEKIDDYKNEYLPKYKFSKLRLSYLIQTIAYLQKHGRVYLVRLPIHPQMMEIENLFMPDFNSKINELASSLNISYFDLTNLNEKASFTDGNHLYKDSGKEVSEILGNIIKAQN